MKKITFRVEWQQYGTGRSWWHSPTDSVKVKTFGGARRLMGSYLNGKMGRMIGDVKRARIIQITSTESLLMQRRKA